MFFFLSWTEEYFGVLISPQVSAVVVAVVVASSLVTVSYAEIKKMPAA